MDAVVGQIELTVEQVRSPVFVAGPDASETAVVFLHGNLADAHDWSALLPEVATFARCAAPDLPGFGRADKPADFDYSTNGYARHIAGLVDALGLRRVHLVTHDLGGVWGLAWAAQHPEQLASLTLISIGALPAYRPHRFARIYRTPLLGELTLATASHRSVRWAMQAGSEHVLPADAVDRAVMSSRDPGTRRAILRIYRSAPGLAEATTKAASALRGVDRPTLVIWGTGDPYVPIRYAAKQRDFFPRAQVAELAGCGHYPFLDDPAGVRAALIPFLREQHGVG